MQTWELLTAQGSINRIPLKLVLPVQTEQEFHAARRIATDEFDLDPSLVEFHYLQKAKPDTDRAALMRLRDETVIEMSDMILPLSLRAKGNMLTLLARYKNRGTLIDERFSTPFQKQTRSYAYTLHPEKSNPGLFQLEDKYLTHWTRTVSNRWPDEKLIDFYRAIASSNSYPRSAFNTLCRIVSSRLIMASTKHMPDKVAVVSFSDASPRDLIPLMRWRARYHQMSFEPYGIGISKQLAETLRVRQVNYYREKADPAASSAPVWLNQSVGKITDWRPEREYRHKGDFSLQDIPRDQMILFCRYIAEARELEARFGIRTVPFEIS